jgi:hypothetical protein
MLNAAYNKDGCFSDMKLRTGVQRKAAHDHLCAISCLNCR